MNKNTRNPIFLSLLLIILNGAMAPNHAISQTVADKTSKRYGSKNKMKKWGKKLVGLDRKADLRDFGIKDKHEIIGFEPSWMIKEANFNDYFLNLLSTLVVGEYDINPTTGGYRSRSSFRSQFDVKKHSSEAKQPFNIIQAANYFQPKINILLQLNYYSDYGIKSKQRDNVRSLLTNDDVLKSLTDSLNQYFRLLDLEYDIDNSRTGIVLDFDIENTFYDADFINFVSKIRNIIGDEHLIYLKIPAQVRQGASIDPETISELQIVVDKFIIKGYGFEKYSNEYSPLTVFDKESDYSIESTLKAYTNSEDFFTPKESFAVELPWYGVTFRQDENKNYKLIDGNPYITIDKFTKEIKGSAGKIRYQDNNRVAFLADQETRNVYLIEDSISLVSKYNYLKDSMGMNNLAINGLSYYTDTKNKKKAKSWGGIKDIYGEKREKLGWVIAYYLTAFLPLGFVYSVFKYWEVRNALAKFNKFWNRFRLFFALFIIIFITCTGVGGARYLLVLVGLFIMLCFFIYIMIKKMMMKSKKFVNIVK